MPLSSDDERRVRAIAREVAGEVFDARGAHLEQTIVTAVGSRFKEALEPFRAQRDDLDKMKADISDVRMTVKNYDLENKKQTEMFVQLAEAKGRLAQIDKQATTDLEVNKLAVDRAVRIRTAFLVFLGVVVTAVASLVTAALMSGRH
jgi:hypothetical protein